MTYSDAYSNANSNTHSNAPKRGLTRFWLRRFTPSLPVVLQFFSLIPIGALAYRSAQLLGQVELPQTAFDQSFGDHPLALVIHMVAAVLLVTLGAGQMSTRLRMARPAWHRKAGYVTWASGLLVGLSGLWLVAFHPIADGSLPITQAVRAVFGAGMVWWALAGLHAILNRQIARHRAHMLRLYIMGVSVTTNAVIFGIWVAAGQELSAIAFTVLLTIGWLLALGYSEWRVRKA